MVFASRIGASHGPAQRQHLTGAFAAALITALVRCAGPGDASDDAGHDAAVHVDAGSSHDGATASDAGTGSDAAAPVDAGSPVDDADATDSGTHTDSGTPGDSAHPSDTTRPTVAVVMPAAGATVGGTVNISGTAGDDVAVARVEVQIDSGAFVQASGTATWTLAWDSTGVTGGTHTITARATDTSGNTATSARTVTVSNTASTTCDRTATNGSTLTTQFAAATAGQTICLAAGSYGTFHGGSKTGRVTVRAQTGATVTMEIAFNAAQQITVDGVTVSGLDISRSHDITMSHIRFTGQAIVHVGIVANANLVFDGNTHIDTPTCTSCFAGRLHIDPEGSAVSGVTIRNSLFDGGAMDGIRADANTILIEGNEFRNLADMDPFHTDPIQIYGGQRITIRGNFFHDNHVASNIGGWDGNDHNVIENNVVVAFAGTGEAISILSDHGSIIRHNTLTQGTCLYGWHCGIINIDHKTSDPPSTGTVIEDNILSEIEMPGATAITTSHNLLTGTMAPTYVGPSTTYAGFHLTATSPGHGAASDGSDVGIP